mmetsp:Transcript_13716/g.37043  ORF Transcript_13716/g.37043 Transcript_13716/m.37043 type:complete len:271 (-) Transcript_13716:143-955(-)
MASSRVGEITNAPTPLRGKNFTLYNKSRAGTKNDNVLPLPVFAAARTSFPFSRCGMDLAWISVSVSKLLSFNAFFNGSQISSASNRCSLKKPAGRNDFSISKVLATAPSTSPLPSPSAVSPPPSAASASCGFISSAEPAHFLRFLFFPRFFSTASSSTAVSARTSAGSDATSSSAACVVSASLFRFFDFFAPTPAAEPAAVGCSPLRSAPSSAGIVEISSPSLPLDAPSFSSPSLPSSALPSALFAASCFALRTFLLASHLVDRLVCIVK